MASYAHALSFTEGHRATLPYAGLRWASLAEGHRDVGPLGVLEAVHGAQLSEHVQAVGEDEDEEQGGYQAHPDARCEEARAVTGIGK